MLIELNTASSNLQRMLCCPSTNFVPVATSRLQTVEARTAGRHWGRPDRGCKSCARELANIQQAENDDEGGQQQSGSKLLLAKIRIIDSVCV